MTGKRLLVIGGSGFIGRHLRTRLSDEGHHVTALVRSRQNAEHLASLSIDTVVSGERVSGPRNDATASWVDNGTAAQKRGLSTDTATRVDVSFFFRPSDGFGAGFTAQQRLDRNYRVNPRKQYVVDLLRNRHFDAEALAPPVQRVSAVNTLCFLANLS